MRSLFDECCTPLEVENWVDNIESEDVKSGPIRELLEVVFNLQKCDTEPPELASVRLRLNESTGENFSKDEISLLIQSLRTFIPGFISLEGERVGIQGTPDTLMQKIHLFSSEIPTEMRSQYHSAFGIT